MSSVSSNGWNDDEVVGMAVLSKNQTEYLRDNIIYLENSGIITKSEPL